MIRYLCVILITTGLVSFCERNIAETNLINDQIAEGKARLLGSGSFGAVYLSKIPDPENPKAMIDVVVKREIASAPEEFETEVSILTHIHKEGIMQHVPRLHHCWRNANDRHYLIMDYIKYPLNISIPGKNKDESITNPSYVEFVRLSLSDRLLIYSKTAEALAELASRKVIHGDFKPESIMMTEVSAKGKVYIIDFNGSAIGDNRPHAFTYPFLDKEFIDHYHENKRKEKPYNVMGYVNGDKQDVFALAVSIYQLENSYDQYTFSHKYILHFYNHNALKSDVDEMIKLLTETPWQTEKQFAKFIPQKNAFLDLIKRMVTLKRAERPTASEVAAILAQLSKETIQQPEQRMPSADRASFKKKRTVGCFGCFGI